MKKKVKKSQIQEKNKETIMELEIDKNEDNFLLKIATLESKKIKLLLKN